MKTAGFDIESTKIRNLFHLKKMLFLLVFAYTIYLLIGDMISKKSQFKKTSKIMQIYFVYFYLRKTSDIKNDFICHKAFL